MIPTLLTVTRAQLVAALAGVGAEDLAESVRPRLLSIWDGAVPGQTGLDLYFEQPQELAVFLLAMYRAFPDRADMLADRTRTEGAHAYWPGVVIDGELSPEQEADAARAAADDALAVL